MEVRKFYDALLEDGDLFHVLEDAKGNWKEDKKQFMEYYSTINNYLTGLEVNTEEV